MDWMELLLVKPHVGDRQQRSRKLSCLFQLPEFKMIDINDSSGDLYTWIGGQKLEDMIVASRISIDTADSPGSAPKNLFTKGYLKIFHKWIDHKKLRWPIGNHGTSSPKNY